MKKTSLLFFFLIMMIHPAWASETQFVFADIKTGQAILTADDNYFNRMSAAEIAIRSRSATATKTADDLKAQYAANVLEWTDQEKAQITQLVADNRKKLNGIASLLPAKVIFIKVTDQVEGGLPHTRANAIILPLSDKPLTEKLFYHELFHVLSRNQKARHDSLYDLIGFKSCDFTATAEIQAKMLTNPDVPAEGYYLPVTIDNKPSAIMTFLHAAYPAFNPEVKGGFGGHFGFGLLKLKVSDGHCTVDPDPAGKAQILNPGTVPEFFAAIGQNTSYIIHPEEVLAENFVFVMTDKQGLPNPEILARLGTWLGLK
ncbi:hypothetical protein MNBD_ALPHA02-1224 [hydrothermal vent metagenome]|uniref:Uncharacterized protein n=1 Tax=hydrothermal vent metagenome TaxID=652676 RepID=A0A3B0S9L5_9ZZZZ